jgi:hypothetical protein
MARRFREHAAFDDRLPKLFDEQWNAIRTIYDLVGDLLGQRLAAGHVHDHFDTILDRQAAQTEQRHVWVPDPRRRKLRPEDDDKKHPEGRHALDEQV